MFDQLVDNGSKNRPSSGGSSEQAGAGNEGQGKEGSALNGR